MRNPLSTGVRGPPALLVGSAVAVAASLWLGVRLLLGAVLGVATALRGDSVRLPDLLPAAFPTTLIVCAVVAALAAVDARWMKEIVFRENLGLPGRSVIALSAGCSLLLELVLAVILRAATGG